MQMSASIYSLKPRFQRLLSPMRDYLVAKNISPNQITLVTCALCIGYALLIAWPLTSKYALLLLPVLLFVRMMLNALDGMVATSTDKQTPLGSVLNELCDVVSDIALFGSFLLLLPESQFMWIFLILSNLLTEFVALAVFQASHHRPHNGPFGKSDRAFYLGIMAIILFFLPKQILLIDCVIFVGCILSLLTILNRLKTIT